MLVRLIQFGVAVLSWLALLARSATSKNAGILGAPNAATYRELGFLQQRYEDPDTTSERGQIVEPTNPGNEFALAPAQSRPRTPSIALNRADEYLAPTTPGS